MKKTFSLLIATAALSLNLKVKAQTPSEAPTDWLKNATAVVGLQLANAAKTYTPGQNPRSVTCGTVRLANYRDWTTGFFPGSLWYGYELTGNKALAESAKRFTLALDSVRYITDTHDVGFMLYCSYGNGYRITGDKVYLPALSQGVENLYNRFSPKVGAIRSWDFKWWNFPVIIDNMMNLEYLYWGAKALNKPVYSNAANTHAITTMKNHYRKDFSSYHVVDYDGNTGKIIAKRTHQGLTDESAWSRGQAWGLYGYAMCYENSKNPQFVAQAEKIAKYIMNHPSIPKDRIPAWDLDAHNANDHDGDGSAPRDASAAAVIACGLLKLSTQVSDGQKYFSYAEEILRTLSSDKYLAKPGENSYFLLKHSVGAFLYNSEIDTPLDYADYYYLEALNQYKKISSLKK